MLIIFFLHWLLSFQAPTFGQFIDLRDGHRYRTIRIGDQEWLADNLAYRADSSYCYDDHPFPCRRYGRLYIWSSAQNACPNGWRLPTQSEWNTLYRLFPNGIDAYKALTKNGTAGLEVKLAGWRSSNENYLHAGERAYFWSAEEVSDSEARCYRFDLKDQIMSSHNTTKNQGFSCRCIR